MPKSNNKYSYKIQKRHMEGRMHIVMEAELGVTIKGYQEPPETGKGQK